MAQKVTTHLVDDLTGDTIEDSKGRTMSFSFDGAHYEIDLTDDNADALREAFSDYVAAGFLPSRRRRQTAASSVERLRGAARGRSELHSILAARFASCGRGCARGGQGCRRPYDRSDVRWIVRYAGACSRSLPSADCPETARRPSDDVVVPRSQYASG
ncbi:Lsr2 family protein, partial [Sphingomonas sp. LR61]|uniref:Lsr2 dimerization domain-containing protein n=1 Tax=Sphingomonas sp. LR61 TaxID=3050234 RepID=UPI002FE30E41